MAVLLYYAVHIDASIDPDEFKDILSIHLVPVLRMTSHQDLIYSVFELAMKQIMQFKPDNLLKNMLIVSKEAPELQNHRVYLLLLQTYLQYNTAARTHAYKFKEFSDLSAKVLHDSATRPFLTEAVISPFFSTFTTSLISLFTRRGYKHAATTFDGLGSFCQACEAFFSVLIERHKQMPSCVNPSIMFLLGVLVTNEFKEEVKSSHRQLYRNIVTVLFAVENDLIAYLAATAAGNTSANDWLKNEAPDADPEALVANFALRAPGMLLKPEFGVFRLVGLIQLVFEHAPYLFSQITMQNKYLVLLRSLSNSVMAVLIAPDASQENATQIVPALVQLCFSYLFSPHPFIANLSLDLLCLLIRSTSSTYQSDFRQTLSALIEHILDLHLPAGQFSMAHLRASDPVLVRLRSILHRIITSMADFLRRGLFEELFPRSTLNRLLSHENVTLTDRDFAYVAIWPHAYWNERYNIVLSQLISTIRRCSSSLQSSSQSLSSTEASKSSNDIAQLIGTTRETEKRGSGASSEAELTLALKAAAHLVSMLSSHLLPATVKELAALVQQLISSAVYSTATLNSEIFANYLNLVVVCSNHAPLQWQHLISKFSVRMNKCQPIAKIAFVQFLTAGLAETAPSAEISSLVTPIFNMLLDDPHWFVTVEAICAYCAVAKRHDLPLKSKEDWKQDFGPNAVASFKQNLSLSRSVQQLLLESVQDFSTQLFLNKLTSFRKDLLQLAEATKTDSTAGQSSSKDAILLEIARSYEKLYQLEASLGGTL